MIEMLGVLAVIAVLSVAGIAGFNKAMMEYKITKTLNQYGELFNNIFTHEKQLRRIRDEQGTATKIGNQLKALNIIPDGWTHNYEGITDPLGIFSYVMSYEKAYYVLSGETQIHMQTHIKRLEKPEEIKFRFCQRYIADVIKPWSSKINRLLVLTNPWTVYDGDNTSTCQKGQAKCLRDITLNEISEICNRCRPDDQIYCGFYLYF